MQAFFIAIVTLYAFPSDHTDGANQYYQLCCLCTWTSNSKKKIPYEKEYDETNDSE